MNLPAGHSKFPYHIWDFSYSGVIDETVKVVTSSVCLPYTHPRLAPFLFGNYMLKLLTGKPQQPTRVLGFLHEFSSGRMKTNKDAILTELRELRQQLADFHKEPANSAS